MKKLRIVYLGTPDFAVASLNILHTNGYQIVGVITAPDKPAGRGLSLRQTPVKEYALKNGLNILQPSNLKSEEFINDLAELKADLFIVVAFRMLPEVVWSMPPRGTFNLHASLLPQYRGAAPINYAIINGEKTTGVTTFFLQHEIDTGDIIGQVAVNIDETDTAGSLHDKLMLTGADLVLDTVRKIEANQLNSQAQKELDSLKTAPKIFKDDCLINWERTSLEVYNFIRGLSPYPGAFTKLDHKTFKIYWAEKEEVEKVKPASEILSDGKNYLSIATKDGAIKCLEVQLEGKKKMDIKDFLRGYTIKEGITY